MKKEGKFMIDEIMDQMKTEGSDNGAIYQKILETSENWDISYRRTNDEAWARVSKKALAPATRTISMKPWLRWAASVALLVAALSVWFLLSPSSANTYIADQYTEIVLPDGSKVAMDVGTTLSYDEQSSGDRNVTVEGLAYFDVTKGTPFTIQTDQGSVQVLGTTFNVNTFGSELKVECFTGKVMVEANSSVAILTPGARIKTINGELGTIERFDRQNGVAWMEGEYHYQNAPINEVITDLARQFDIEITIDVKNSNRTYSGLFSTKDNVEDALKAITLPMGLSYKKIEENRYQVID